MVDLSVSFSNQNSLDIFPSFKSFHKPKDDQGAFTIDSRDLKEMEKNIPTNESKQNNSSPAIFKKAISNPLAQCDICSVPITSQIVYNSHIKGKKHQTQLTNLLSKNPQYKPLTYKELCSNQQESIVMNNQSETSEPPVNENYKAPPLVPTKMLNCNLCTVSCNSQQMFENHVAGKKHQVKLKSANLPSPAPPRNVPDNNPSSSNYCDVCSLKLNSEDELIEHLAQKQHQTQVKEKTYAKEASDMNINFDDYKISPKDTEKNNCDYQCAKCNKKLRNKIQLIDHLKSASHIELANQSNNQDLSKKSNRGSATRGGATRGGVTRGGASTRSQSFSAPRGSNKPSRKSRPYPPERPSYNQLPQSFDQQPTNNIFGAFDPNNQSTFSSNSDSYSRPKRSAQFEENPNEYSGFYPKPSTQYEETRNEYDGFYPKRSRTYNDEANTSQDVYSTERNYYPSHNNQYSSQTSDYNNQPLISDASWQYQTEQYYDQQQYSNSGSSYINPTYYPPNQPPLPNYEPPPLPSYLPSSSQMTYSQNSTYPGSTNNQGNNNYYPNSFHQ